jgi:hypothetical protein
MRAIVLVLAVVAAILAPSAAAAQSQGANDYCASSPRATLLLFDRTTPFDDNERDAARIHVGAVVDGLLPRERIVVATIERHYSVSRQVFDACLPGCPPGAALWCSGVRADREARGFRARLFAAIRPLLAPAPEQRNSDVTGTIARQSRGRRFDRVVIYSDMLENSEALPWTQFRDGDNAALMQTARAYGLVARLPGAGVEIVGFGRSHDPGRAPLPAAVDQKIRRFWTAYFSAAGAAAPAFE